MYANILNDIFDQLIKTIGTKEEERLQGQYFVMIYRLTLYLI